MATPTLREFSKLLGRHSKDAEQWAGFPIPIEGQRLVIEPKYPHKDALERFQFGTSLHVDTSETINEAPEVEINRFWSDYKGTDVIIFRQANGRSIYGLQTHNRGSMLINTIGSSMAWSLDAEIKATQKLCELISDHAITTYALTGMFLETSKRSGVTYIFRKLKPTLALKANQKGEMKILCGLCRHSIGYYEGTWAGVMVPTDEVLAALVWMRGDEHGFWKGCNQHAAHRPECGL